ncbi:MAG: hypothetical protein H0U44_01635 [Flavisolibacter sp.]|jgi:hypothetical protein|nr:hypothetical protein [Flavisolibacter sp.]
MKKTMLSLLLAGSCGAALAQVTQSGDTTRTNVYNTTNYNMDHQKNQHTFLRDTMTTTADYSAYGTTSAAVPMSVQGYFDRDYPTAGTVTWRTKGDWYHATYNNQGRYSHVYYNQAGKSFTVALPVTQNYVPDDIVMRVSNMYGDLVYDIATIKGAQGKDLYHVRTLENGQLRSQWIGDDGSTITDPYRNEDTSTEHTNQMNSNQQQSQQNNQQNNQNLNQVQDTSAKNNSKSPVNREQTPLTNDQPPVNNQPAPVDDDQTTGTDGSTSAVLERKNKMKNHKS